MINTVKNLIITIYLCAVVSIMKVVSDGVIGWLEYLRDIIDWKRLPMSSTSCIGILGRKLWPMSLCQITTCKLP